MPLAAYFRNVGAALLALLLLVDFYLPTSPVAQRETAYPPAIRIHTERKPPQPVVFDTTRVVLAAATPAPWDSNPPAPPPTAVDAPGVRNALALSPRTELAASVDQKKRQAARKYAARRHAKPQILLAARQGPFGWFGFGNW
jgi:hypothetical protein